MSTQRCTYRGVSYAPRQLDQAGGAPVDHTYRGLHYSAPLHQEGTVHDETVELHYRGSVYRHRQQEAQRQVNQ